MENDSFKPVVQAIVIRERYCLGQPGGVLVWERQLPDTVTLRLQVRLVYRNAGKDPLILPLWQDPRLIVARNRDELERQNQSLIKFEPTIPHLEHPSVKDFKVIPPGDAIEPLPRENIILPVHTRSSEGSKSDMLGKRIFLQLELDHLQFSNSIAHRLADEWKRLGNLWTGKVRTEPIEVNVPLSPTISDCSREYKVD